MVSEHGDVITKVLQVDRLGDGQTWRSVFGYGVAANKVAQLGIGRYC